jgi:hypothetical protein
MWVLEARKDAEKVWFPIVWEDIKETSNVIDYDIHDEITIDNSSVLNANNDTTTGIANVIPWVNAPKLKLSTSVYIDKLEIPTVNQKLYWEWWYISRPDDPSTFIRNIPTQASYWTDELQYYSSPNGILYSWMQIPIGWYYEMNVRYKASSSTYGFTYQWRTPKWWWSSDIVWHTYTTASNTDYKYETITREFSKWEVFCLFVTMDRYSSTPTGDIPDILIEIKKL